MFLKDKCGILCVIVTYLAILYADYVVVEWIVLQTMHNSLWGAFHVVIFNSMIFLLAFSHMKAVLSDPGTVPLPQSRLDFSDIHSGDGGYDREDWTVCTRCETYRPPRAHHCRICKRCVRRMDHHCPWINNCVGEQNQKFFLQFLVYVGILAIYAIVLVILSWLRDCPDCNEEFTMKQSRILHSVILLLESAFFGLFVVVMLIDQVHAIITDETTVEQFIHKGVYQNYRTEIAMLGEVCGGRHPLFWLLPCSAPRRKPDTPLLSHEV